LALAAADRLTVVAKGAFAELTDGGGIFAAIAVFGTLAVAPTVSRSGLAIAGAFTASNEIRFSETSSVAIVFLDLG